MKEPIVEINVINKRSVEANRMQKLTSGSMPAYVITELNNDVIDESSNDVVTDTLFSGLSGLNVIENEVYRRRIHQSGVNKKSTSNSMCDKTYIINSEIN